MDMKGYMSVLVAQQAVSAKRHPVFFFRVDILLLWLLYRAIKYFLSKTLVVRLITGKKKSAE